MLLPASFLLKVLYNCKNSKIAICTIIIVNLFKIKAHTLPVSVSVW